VIEAQYSRAVNLIGPMDQAGMISRIIRDPGRLAATTFPKVRNNSKPGLVTNCNAVTAVFIMTSEALADAFAVVASLYRPAPDSRM
jgi:hypothetical protein